MEFPSQDQTKRNSFFGCIPPESGFTVFSAWWFDVYHPDEEFNQRGREEIKHRMNTITKEDRIRLLTNEDTVRFLVVRHPMTRFVSSWVRDYKKIDFLVVKFSDHVKVMFIYPHLDSSIAMCLK